MPLGRRRFFQAELACAHLPGAAEIVMFDSYIVVYKCVGDLMFYVTGSQDENELILYSVLVAFYESVSILLRYCLRPCVCAPWGPWGRVSHAQLPPLVRGCVLLLEQATSGEENSAGELGLGAAGNRRNHRRGVGGAVRFGLLWVCRRAALWTQTPAAAMPNMHGTAPFRLSLSTGSGHAATAQPAASLCA
jgi:hypothetical protein